MASSRAGWVRCGWLAASVVLASAATGCAGANDGPRAEEDFVEVYTTQLFPLGSSQLDEDEGELIGPRFDFKIEEIAVGESLDDLFGSMAPEQLEPADGHEFLVAAVVNRRIASREDSVGQAGGPVATVAVGETVVPLDTFPEPSSIGNVVVSVPEGEEAELRVDDGGRMQAISLRTGLRTEQADGFYATVRQDLAHTYLSPASLPGFSHGRVEGEQAYEVRLALTEATREPWLVGDGYPPEGRAWLSVALDGLELSVPAGQTPDSSPCRIAAAILSENAFTIVDENGREIPAEPGVVGPEMLTTSVDFNVPEDFTTGTLRIAPANSLLMSFSGELRPLDPRLCSWIAAPVEQTIDIQLAPVGD